MGAPPTGKAVAFEVFEIVRFAGDGEAVELNLQSVRSLAAKS